jgi:hypothetical protein
MLCSYSWKRVSSMDSQHPLGRRWSMLQSELHPAVWSTCVASCFRVLGSKGLRMWHSLFLPALSSAQWTANQELLWSSLRFVSQMNVVFLQLSLYNFRVWWSVIFVCLNTFIAILPYWDFICWARHFTTKTVFWTCVQNGKGRKKCRTINNCCTVYEFLTVSTTKNYVNIHLYC